MELDKLEDTELEKLLKEKTAEATAIAKEWLKRETSKRVSEQ